MSDEHKKVERHPSLEIDNEPRPVGNEAQQKLAKHLAAKYTSLHKTDKQVVEDKQTHQVAAEPGQVQSPSPAETLSPEQMEQVTS